MAEKWEMAIFDPFWSIFFGPIFPFCGHFSSFFRSGQNPFFCPFFSHFGPEARFGVCTGESGSQSLVFQEIAKKTSGSSRNLCPESLVVLNQGALDTGKGKPALNLGSTLPRALCPPSLWMCPPANQKARNAEKKLKWCRSDSKAAFQVRPITWLRND